MGANEIIVNSQVPVGLNNDYIYYKNQSVIYRERGKNKNINDSNNKNMQFPEVIILYYNELLEIN